MRLWDLTTGQPAGDATIADIDDDVDGSIFNGRPQFSPDGEYIDVATFHGVARFSATDLRPVRLTTTTFNLMGDVDHVPGTDDVIAAGIGGQIGRWDMSTGELIATGRSRESSSLWDVAVSPDGIARRGRPHLFARARRVRCGDVASARRTVCGRRHALHTAIHTRRDDRQRPVQRHHALGHGPRLMAQTACVAAGRNLTRDEWVEFIGAEEPYRLTCS